MSSEFIIKVNSQFQHEPNLYAKKTRTVGLMKLKSNALATLCRSHSLDAIKSVTAQSIDEVVAKTQPIAWASCLDRVAGCRASASPRDSVCSRLGAR